MMFHIVQGGIENGDKKHLETAAARHKGVRSWITPKSVVDGDEAVIFLGSAFFATARIASKSKPRPDWGPRAYGAALRSIRLIEPPVSLSIIRKKIPELTWAIYPRSVTTVTSGVAAKIRRLISDRRRKGGRDVEDVLLDLAGTQELRARALADARPIQAGKIRMAAYRTRSLPVHQYVLARAQGYCEGCGDQAPFKTKQRMPYLEPHHTIRLADDGPDHPRSVIALCPTCHRRVHYSVDGDKYNLTLMTKLRRLESGR
jgi:hypothetical protein